MAPPPYRQIPVRNTKKKTAKKAVKKEAARSYPKISNAPVITLKPLARKRKKPAPGKGDAKGTVIDEKSDSLGDLVSDTLEKGKDLIHDITTKDSEVVEETDEIPDETPEKDEKSARERLKDKGLL